MADGSRLRIDHINFWHRLMEQIKDFFLHFFLFFSTPLFYFWWLVLMSEYKMGLLGPVKCMHHDSLVRLMP